MSKYNSSQYDSSYYINGGWTTSEHLHQSINDDHSSRKPSFINITNYFRHLIDLLTPEDNIFLTLNLFFSSGQISYVDKFEEFFRDSTSFSTYGDTTLSSNTDNYDTKNVGTSFSAGYSLSKTFNDLFLLSGIRFSGYLERLENVDIIDIQEYYNSTQVFVRSKVYPVNASFTLPLYLNYKAAEWCSVYGGLNYTYSYFRYKIEHSNTENHHLSINPEIRIFNNNENYVSQGWQSYKSIYAGFELAHKSGLKLQFYFDKDFSMINNWNVSVGYHF